MSLPLFLRAVKGQPGLQQPHRTGRSRGAFESIHEITMFSTVWGRIEKGAHHRAPMEHPLCVLWARCHPLPPGSLRTSQEHLESREHTDDKTNVVYQTLARHQALRMQDLI